MNMTSLIDVTFLLLIYFMVSMVIAKPEDRLNPTIRTQDASASGSEADFQPQIVEVILVSGIPTYRLGQHDLVEDVVHPLPRKVADYGGGAVLGQRFALLLLDLLDLGSEPDPRHHQRRTAAPQLLRLRGTPDLHKVQTRVCLLDRGQPQ